jgi:hypothetical protein
MARRTWEVDFHVPFPVLKGIQVLGLERYHCRRILTLSIPVQQLSIERQEAVAPAACKAQPSC